MAHGVDAERQLGMVRREGQSLRSVSDEWTKARPGGGEQSGGWKIRIRCSFTTNKRRGWPVSPMLYMFDKVIHRLRRAAGSQLSIEQVRNELARVEQWVARAKVILREQVGSSSCSSRPVSRPKRTEREGGVAQCASHYARVGDTVRLVPVIRAPDNALNSIRLRAEDLTRM